MKVGFLFSPPLPGCLLRGAWPAGTSSAASRWSFGIPVGISRRYLKRIHLHGVVAHSVSADIGLARSRHPLGWGGDPPGLP